MRTYEIYEVATGAVIATGSLISLQDLGYHTYVCGSGEIELCEIRYPQLAEEITSFLGTEEWTLGIRPTEEYAEELEEDEASIAEWEARREAEWEAEREAYMASRHQ